MSTLQELRIKAGYKTIKAFAEFYGCGATKASGILNGKYHLTLSKGEVLHLATVLKVTFAEAADACDNTFAELKGYKGDAWKQSKRKYNGILHKGIWARWQWEEDLQRYAKKAAESGDWTEYRARYTASSTNYDTKYSWSNTDHSYSWERRSSSQEKDAPFVSATVQAAFNLLGVSIEATPEQIHQAFRCKARAMHPDTGGNGNVGMLVKAKETALQYAGKVKVR